MPDARDEHDRPAEPASAAPDDAVVDAELVDAAPVDDAPAAGEAAAAAPQEPIVDAEVVEADSAGEEGGGDSAEDPGAGNRPSVHGRLAKPRKRKRGKDAETGDADGESGGRKKADPAKVRRILLVFVTAVAAAALVAAGLFCWQKWMRFDDAADIQGVWKVQSTGDTIVFDGGKLKLTKGISYEYELDAGDKTIAYTFGDLSGGGHYYFSGDRKTLVIVEGDERLGILAEAGFLPAGVVEHDDANDDKTVLAKVSDDTSAEPSGKATGVAHGGKTGEREYVVEPEPEPSSSSSSGAKKSSSSHKDDEDDEDAEHDGFVDEDGDGYDDYSGLDYEEFYADSDDADGESEDGEPEDGESDDGDEAADGDVDPEGADGDGEHA